MKHKPSREENNIEVFTQARNPVIYSILKNDNHEQFAIPIDGNTLKFSNKDLNKQYFKSLYINESDSSISPEFKHNLVYFYVYFTLILMIIVSSASSYYSKDLISIQELRFHLMSSLIILTFGYIFLLALLKTRFFLNHNREFFFILSIIFNAYLLISHQNILSTILSVPKPQYIMPITLYIAGYHYFFRLVTFDNHIYIILLSSISSISFLISQNSVSTSRIEEKFCEYLSLTLILLLNCIESYKVSTRSTQLFYRIFKENLENKYQDENKRESNTEFISSSELVIEKCDKVINEMQNAKKIIIFKDIRDRFKSAIKDLIDIKKYLGHLGVNDEIISISDSANIDEEDKEFLAQNFLSITGFVKEYNKNRHLTLKDLLSKRERVSLSMNALATGADTLDAIGNDWNLNIFELANKLKDPLALIAKHFFYKWDIGALLRVDREIFFRFFENIEINYHNNPYHNSKHACCVFNSFMCFVTKTHLDSMLTPLESIVSMVAVLAHDIGHPGVTNRYLIASKNDLALRYNDISVLENMHCALVYTLLNDPNCNIFSRLKSSEWTNCRKVLIELIMSTDMSKHFELLSRFRMRTCSLHDLNEEIFEDRNLALCVALKCADLGHSAKTFVIHENWTQLLCEEFFLQGDLEKENGLPVSIYCDRANIDIGKSQAGFIKNVCVPLFEVFGLYCKSDYIDRYCLDQLQKNLNIWDERSKDRGGSLFRQKDEKEEFLSKVLVIKH